MSCIILSIKVKTGWKTSNRAVTSIFKKIGATPTHNSETFANKALQQAVFWLWYCKLQQPRLSVKLQKVCATIFDSLKFKIKLRTPNWNVCRLVQCFSFLFYLMLMFEKKRCWRAGWQWVKIPPHYVAYFLRYKLHGI